jgi:hypothetical protein
LFVFPEIAALSFIVVRKLFKFYLFPILNPVGSSMRRPLFERGKDRFTGLEVSEK